MSRHPSHKRAPLRIVRRRGKKRIVLPRRVRRVVPGTVWFITKKCRDDLYLIRPDPLVNWVLLYSLLLSARRRGVSIHGFCFMSNHFHLLCTDVEGQLPAFMRDFLVDSCKAIQVGLDDSRRLWDGKRYSAVECLDLDAAERKHVYIELNPLRAGLTEPTEWPGLTSAIYTFGQTITVKRPPVYFSRRRPEEVALALEPIAPSYRGGVLAWSQARLEFLAKEERATIHDDFTRKGRRIAGADTVLATSRHEQGRRILGQANPRFATADRMLMADALAEERAFQERHAAAVTSYIEGRTRTHFPLGTYGYHELLEVRVARGDVVA